MTLRKCVAYCRLSRDDERSPGTTEEKLQGQVESCRRLAAQHNLPVHDVLIERASGGSLAGRPELLKLLLLCRRGEVSHILCTFSDRLSRLDGRDRWDFEEALQEGCVTVITTQGIEEYEYEKGNQLYRGIQAEFAAEELRKFSRRLRLRNQQKIQENKRTGGGPPYGYRKDPDGPGGYSIVPTEYPTLCRILRTMLTGASQYRLACDLNEEGIPPPGARGTRAGKQWRQTGIRNIALNFFYAGRHGQRYKIVMVGGKKKLVELPVDEYVIAPTEGDWIHPLSWEEYSRIRAMYSGRRYSPVPVGLLTGLLYCPDGGSMARMGPKRYQCYCRTEHTERHAYCIAREKVEGAARDAVREALCSFSRTAFKAMPGKENRSDLYLKHAQAQRTLRETFMALEQLASNRSLILQYSDQGAYEEMLRRAGTAHNAAKAEERRICDLLSQPEAEYLLPVLEGVKRKGFDRMYEEMTEDERRVLLRSFIARLDLRPKPSLRGVRHLPPVVTLAEWVRQK